MYVEIDEALKDEILKNSSVTVHLRLNSTNVSRFDCTPFKIFFNSDFFPKKRIHIFDFYLSETQSSWIITNLKLTKESKEFPISDRILFLQEFLKEIFKRAKVGNKTTICISTELEFAPEILSQHMFSIDNKLLNGRQVYRCIYKDKVAKKRKALIENVKKGAL